MDAWSSAVVRSGQSHHLFSAATLSAQKPGSAIIALGSISTARALFVTQQFIPIPRLSVAATNSKLPQAILIKASNIYIYTGKQRLLYRQVLECLNQLAALKLSCSTPPTECRGWGLLPTPCSVTLGVTLLRLLLQESSQSAPVSVVSQMVAVCLSELSVRSSKV